PGLAAVGRLVQAALLVRAPDVAEGGDIDDVGVGGVDDDAADVLRVPQAHVLPGLAAVGRFVDAVAPGDAVAGVGLAGADPDHVGVRFGDGHVAERNRRLALEDGRPGGAIVDGLPQAARRGGHVQ